MDYHLRQWRDQRESGQPPSANIPTLLLEPHQQPCASALPLFVTEPNSRISNMSAFPDSTTTTTRFHRMGSFFSLAQWQELELQALIFKHMVAGAAVPPELIQPIKKSVLNTLACYPHHPLQYQHYQPAMLPSGYWGKSIVDAEPGRCRRTDGKKWRCSRDVVAGHKYCERHMNRGRNRSRKPVEISTPAAAAGAPIAASPLTAVASGSHFAPSASLPSIDLHHLNQRTSEGKTGNGGLMGNQHENISSEGRSDNRVLWHFFDDWPRSNQEHNSVSVASTTDLCHSSSGNLASDFSLKLSTGNEDEPRAREGERPQLNWVAGWNDHPVASMGGPLAEALRSSTSNSSPTSVLHEIPPGFMSEPSSISI